MTLRFVLTASDSVTKNFLQQTMDPVFGFPGIVRFAWSTAEKILEAKGVAVSWAEEDEDEQKASKENTPSVLDFFARQQQPNKAIKADVPQRNEVARHFFFSDRCLQPLQSL
ncbi:hypothetical protein FHG87_020412 [Trinorchestia longiramus]|nr:hypothetical protein FHG87_020412 [Trinorchestia longiramus]